MAWHRALNSYVCTYNARRYEPIHIHDILAIMTPARQAGRKSGTTFVVVQCDAALGGTVVNLPVAEPRDISYVARHTGDYCGPRRPDGGTWMNAEHSPFLLLLFVHTLSSKYKKNESSSS